VTVKRNFGMRLKAWLEILRLPNLFTVPGDPVVGYVAASAGRGTLRAVAPVAAAALFLYAAGLLFNDLADIERDRRSRPSRPLPSGRLDAGGVAVAASGLPALALIFCIQAGWATAVTGLLLLAAILVYDFFLKERGLWGAVMMGICRGLSVMLGASVAGVAWKSPRVMTVSGAMAVVVGAVTYAARVETGEEQLRGVRWLVPAAIVVAGVGVLSAAGGVELAGGLFFAGVGPGDCGCCESGVGRSGGRQAGGRRGDGGRADSVAMCLHMGRLGRCGGGCMWGSCRRMVFEPLDRPPD